MHSQDYLNNDEAVTYVDYDGMPVAISFSRPISNSIDNVDGTKLSQHTPKKKITLFL